ARARLYAAVQPPTAASLADVVPADSFDFYGMSLPETVAGTPNVFKNLHYVRRHGAGANEWRFVYPGEWHAAHPWNTAATYPYRQQGVDESLPWTAGGTGDPWAAGAMGSVGGGVVQPVTLGTAIGD